MFCAKEQNVYLCNGEHLVDEREQAKNKEKMFVNKMTHKSRIFDSAIAKTLATISGEMHEMLRVFRFSGEEIKSKKGMEYDILC